MSRRARQNWNYITLEDIGRQWKQLSTHAIAHESRIAITGIFEDPYSCSLTQKSGLTPTQT
jgi:hypothetical protein